mgnify:CR=1 FL=1
MSNANLSLLVDPTWRAELEKTLGVWEGVKVHDWSPSEDRAGVYFFNHLDLKCEEKIKALNRKGKAVFLIVQEGASVPKLWVDGLVDDILVYPFRRLEILGKLRGYQQVLLWEEVTRLNASFSQVVDGLHEDLKLAERLQKARLPQRFPELKGVKLASRYLAGLKPGGDYFEVIEFKEKSRLSIILSDSSSYGLSGMVLAALMQIAFKLGREADLSCADVVRTIAWDLGNTLTEKDQLSLFFGHWHKRESKLQFLRLGNVFAYRASEGDAFQLLPSQGGILKGNEPGLWSELQAEELRLEPKDRLVVASEGFVKLCGGAQQFERLLDQHRQKEPIDALNEMAYQVKKSLSLPDDLPERDCTALVIDVPGNVVSLKLARDET